MSGETRCGSSEQGPEGFALNSHSTRAEPALWRESNQGLQVQLLPSTDHPEQIPALPWHCSCTPCFSLHPSAQLGLHQLQPWAGAAAGQIQAWLRAVRRAQPLSQDSPGSGVHNPCPCTLLPLALPRVQKGAGALQKDTRGCEAPGWLN